MAIYTIKFKRGTKNKLKSLSYGEPAYISDENELYIGTESGVEKITRNQEVEEMAEKISVLDVNLENIIKHEVINVEKYGAKGDGITDNTEILQNLLDTKKSLFFPSGIYIASNLYLNSYNTLYGEGYSSQLKQKANSEGHFITLKNKTTHSIKIEKIYINGNSGNQTHANDAVHLVNSVDEIQEEDLIDHYHILRDVHIEKVKGNGLYAYYTREITVDNVKVRQCEKDGIFFHGSDSFFSNCTVSTSKNGYHFITGATKVINCKAFVNDVGFSLDGVYCTSLLLNNCDTQSNSIGFKLLNCNSNMLNGILSNNENNTSIVIENSKFNSINGLIENSWVENSEGIKILGDSYGNSICFNMASNKINNFSNKLIVDKKYSSNDIIINGQQLNKNIFNYSPIDSKLQNKYNTMNITSSNEIEYVNYFENDSLVIEIISNKAINNYGNISISTSEYNLANKFSLSASAEMIVEVGENITPAISFSCFDDVDNLGKIPIYLTDGSQNNIIDGVVTDKSIINNSKKVKIVFSFETSQTVFENQLVGYKVIMKNPKITIN